jgi:hypothetical protein
MVHLTASEMKYCGLPAANLETVAHGGHWAMANPGRYLRPHIWINDEGSVVHRRIRIYVEYQTSSPITKCSSSCRESVSLQLRRVIETSTVALQLSSCWPAVHGKWVMMDTGRPACLSKVPWALDWVPSGGHGRGTHAAQGRQQVGPECVCICSSMRLAAACLPACPPALPAADGWEKGGGRFAEWRTGERRLDVVSG